MTAYSRCWLHCRWSRTYGEPKMLTSAIEKRLCGPIKEKAEKGDGPAKQWMDVFHRLGSHLHVNIVQGINF